jgi:hypothetical protein
MGSAYQRGLRVSIAASLIFLSATPRLPGPESPEPVSALELHPSTPNVAAPVSPIAYRPLASAPARATHAEPTLEGLPLWFEPDGTGGYVTRGSTGSAAVARTGIEIQSSSGSKLRVAFGGALQQGALAATSQFVGRVNYLVGRDTSKWRTNVPTFGRIRAPEVYPGIDVEYYGNRRELEYDFVVRPHADPSVIRIVALAKGSAEITAQGELAVRGQVVQRKPTAYQLVAGARRVVDAKYASNPDGTFGIAVGTYDHTAPLVIDPIVVYVSTLGGTGTDTVTDMTVDDTGSVYVVGYTDSTDFFDLNGLQGSNGGGEDAFVYKLAPNGAMEFATFIGGSAEDRLTNVAIDGSHGIYLAGSTLSTDFPIATPTCVPWVESGHAYPCPVGVRLSPNGSHLLYSTVLHSPSSVLYSLSNKGGSVSRLVVGSDGVAYARLFVFGLECGYEVLIQITPDGAFRPLMRAGNCGVGGGRAIFERLAVGPDGDVYFAGGDPSFVEANLTVRVTRVPPVPNIHVQGLNFGGDVEPIYATRIVLDPTVGGFLPPNGWRVLNLAVRSDGVAVVGWREGGLENSGPSEVRLSSIAPDGTILEPGRAIATFTSAGPYGVSMPRLSFTAAGTLHAAACSITSTSVPPKTCLRVDMDADGSSAFPTSITPAHLLAFGPDAALYSAVSSADVTITKYAHILIDSLDSSRGSPSPIGQAIVWTAAATAAVPIEYTFLRHDSGNGWTVAQPYGPSNTYTWTPGPSDVGTHSLQVWVRAIGSGHDYDHWMGIDFTIDGLVPAVTSLTPSTPLPATAGRTVTWTASLYGGIAPVQCKFVRLDTNVWQVVQDYSANCSYTWQPGLADVGTHALQVWTRNPGSSASYEGYLGTSFDVVAPLPLALTLSGPQQSAAGVPTLWTAMASGGVPPIQYKFLRLDADGWHVGQDFSESSTYQWTPAVGDIGGHVVQVWARRVGSTAAYEAWAGAAVTITNVVPLTVTGLTANPGTGPIGSPITFTSTATGGIAPLEYKFVRLDADTWHVVQDYSYSNTYTWTPSAGDIGTHALQVWVRNSGSTAALHTWGSIEFDVN